MSQPHLDRPAEILLVEDSPTDVVITREAFAVSGVQSTLHVVDNGVEALAFLRQEGRFAGMPRADLVLLDLNLPRKSGLEVLEEVKTDRELKVTPVVVLTTSTSPSDVERSYRLHANCYIAKPVAFAEFVEVVRSLGDHWFGAATLPTATHE